MGSTSEGPEAPEDFFYLPMVIRHELGHVLGLSHTHTEDDAMGEYNTTPTLSDEDQYGIQNVTP